VALPDHDAPQRPPHDARGPIPSLRRRRARSKELSMLDVILVALILGLFAVSVGYVVACDHL
jgi:hypothetical protein